MMYLPVSSVGSIRGLRMATTVIGGSVWRMTLIRSVSKSGAALNSRLNTKSFLGSSRSRGVVIGFLGSDFSCASSHTSFTSATNPAGVS